MSGRRSVSTTQLPQIDDPEAIIRKANAAKAAVAQSQLPTTSTTLATTKEEPSPNRSEAPISNPLVAPAPLTLADNNQPRINPASLPLPDDGLPVDLLPTVDPASIPLPVDTLPSPFLRPREMQNNEAPAPLGIEAGNNQSKDPLTQHPTGDNTPTGLVTGLSTRDLLRALLTCQQASVNQAMADWAKEAVIGVAIKAEDTLGSPRPTSNQVDHRRFKASEGPAYVGPYQEIEPFVVWMNAIELFFTAKDITLDRDRIIIAGERIKEPNLMGFYKTSASKLLIGTWEEFKTNMFTYAIPARWKTTLQRQIRFIKMASNETFMQYTLRARTLQQLLNFDQLTISDHELAIGMSFGLGEDLESRINEHELLEADPFDFNVFVKRAGDCVRSMAKKHPSQTTNTVSHTARSSSPTNYVSNEEYIWQIHAYLDSVGLCHYCKKHCGNISGGCPGPCNRERVPIPTSFKAPPKPASYVAPQAWKGPNNRPVPSTAGRATSRPAGVAAVTDEGGDNLDSPTEDVSTETDDLDYLASISALAIVDEELSVTAADEASVALYAGINPVSVAALWEIPEDDSDEEEYVLYHPPSNCLLHQFHAGRCLRGRVNTGSSTRSMARVPRLIGHKKSLPIDNQLSLDQFTIPIHSSVPTFLVCSLLS
ncbi:hypothetical protein MJO28_007200 [Puccinia striiformis f. sp. tritici]|uniref:Uncharacterized protein n=1 Tax=Puccinia striiformis f. sp. tritici TaxID=168172 RepID=A0ACC0EDW5_9BASI|nr:hypothetical protein MJO28_007200 [Puccinia striiformis f. sp. tritici]